MNERGGGGSKDLKEPGQESSGAEVETLNWFSIHTRCMQLLSHLSCK
jgi:hypothetical protein